MKCILIFLSLFSLLSCSSLHFFTTPFDHTKLGNQVESLFRRQNQASDQVMMLLLEEPSNIDLESIEKAELTMLEACKALNEFAILERDNQKISLSKKQQIIKSIPSCEQKTAALEKILQKIYKQ